MRRQPAKHVPTCVECGSKTRPLRAYGAEPLTLERQATRVHLCAGCLRDRGAAWRMFWKISGRKLGRAA